MKYEWKDVLGNEGVLLTSGVERLLMSLKNESSKVLHVLDIPTARALHEALGRALAEVDSKPITDSIIATLATCSAPVPDILRKIDAACESHLVNVVHGPDGARVYRTPNQSAPEIIRMHPTGTGDHGSIDITTGDGLTRYAVQQVLGKSLRDVTADELAKLGLKPSQPEPPPTGNGASALHPRPFFWDWTGGGFVKVDGSNNRVGIRTTEDLLTRIPNALEAHESSYSQQTDCPSFGFDTEHDRPRTLREYLEAP